MKIRLTAVLIFIVVIGIVDYSAGKSNKNHQEKTSVVFTGATKEKCMSLKNSKIY